MFSNILMLKTMNNINTEHIDDDFLKKLVGQTKEETPSADFTSRVMACIPQTAATPESIDKPMVKPWQWLLLVAAFAGIVYFIYSVDFGSFFNLVATDSPEGQVNYLKTVTSAMQIFSQAFSAFKFTNISLMVVISLVALYFGDRFLKGRATEANQNFA